MADQPASADAAAPRPRLLLDIDAALVWTASIFGALLVLGAGRIIWFQDSWSHFGYAYGMVKDALDPGLFWRGPVYASLILLTGPLATGSIAPLILAQCVLAIVAPVLVHQLVMPAGRRTSLASALVAAASLAPYANMTVIYHDQLIVTGLLGAALIAVRVATRTAHRAEVSLLIVMVLLLAWMRPSLLAIAPAIVVAILVGRRWWKDAGIAMLACVALAFVHGQWAGKGAGDQSTAARQIFFVTYMSSGGLAHDGAAGEARARLATELRQVRDLTSFAANLADYAGLYAAYEGKPDLLAADIFDHPDTRHFWALWRHAIDPATPGWDALMQRMAMEEIARRPLHALGAAADRFKGFALGPSWRYSAATRTMEAPAFWPAYPSAGEPTPIKPIAERWMKHRGGDVVWLASYFSAVISIVQPLAFLLTLLAVGLAIMRPGPARTPTLVIAGMLIPCLAAMALLVDPQTRYQTDFVLLAISGAGLGAGQLMALLRPGAGASPPSRAIALPALVAARPRLALGAGVVVLVAILLALIDAIPPR